MSFRQSFEHSQELFDAALAEFAARGYEQASINAILGRAGMSKGQFYYHFGSKEELYLALIDVLVNKKRAFMQAALAPDALEQDIFSQFEQQIRLGLEFARTYPAIQAFAESFTREVGKPIYHRALERHNFSSYGYLDAMIDRAYERGDFRRDLPPAFIKRAIGHIFSHASEIADLSDMAAAEEQLGYLIALLRGGLES
jgi:AcrR family transcriptional regulator